jgi:hypothetical protein
VGESWDTTLKYAITASFRDLKKGQTIPVTGRGGPKGCEASRFPYFLYNRFTDGGQVVSLTRRPAFTPPPPRKIFWYSFLLQAVDPMAIREAGRIWSIEKCNDLIGNGTRDLPACSTVPQATTLPRASSAPLLFINYPSIRVYRTTGQWTISLK